MNKKHILVILIPLIVSATFPLSQGIITKELYQSKFDDYREVFTYIYGSCHDITINKRGILRNVDFDIGAYWTSIQIEGWRRKIDGSGFEHFYENSIGYIHAPHFLSIIYEEKGIPLRYYVFGFAFGNIDWRGYW